MSSPSSSSLSSLAGRPTPELEEGHLILTTYDTSSSIDSCAVQIDNCRDVSSGAGSSDVSMGDEEESISPPSSVRNDMISFEPSGISKGLPPDALPNYTTRELVNIDEKRPIIRAPSLISSENRQVADLGKYIHDCYYDSGYPYRRPSRTVGGRPIFNQQPGCYKPQLQQSQVNYIILYAGCFNPPHQSHWALLNRAFECCQDLNIVAAIVVLCSGSSKLYGEEMALTKNQKARLWLGDQLHDWIWVFEQSTDLWDSFRVRLTYAASRDGFALDFIFLSGPDHVNTDDVISSWDCKNLIVSDVGREANFVRPGGAYLTLDGYSSWRTLRPDKEELIQKATETAMWLLGSISFTMMANHTYDELIREISLGYSQRMEGVKYCRSHHERDQWIRFIPHRGDIVRVNSTDIRRAIVESPSDELLSSLKGKALHPEMLVGFVNEMRRSKKRTYSEAMDEC